MKDPTATTCGLRHCVNSREASPSQGFPVATTGSVSDVERRLIRILVKEYGWRSTQHGLLKPADLGWGVA